MEVTFRERPSPGFVGGGGAGAVDCLVGFAFQARPRTAPVQNRTVHDGMKREREREREIWGESY